MIKPILNLFFPRLCYACNQTVITAKEYLCISCLHHIPRTNLYKNSDPLVEKRFWGRVQFQRATSFLYFENKGRVQRIIHQFKYQKRAELAIFLGEWAAAELIPTGFFSGIEALIPIPIHPKKIKKRGYNQSELLARGIANLTQIELCKNVLIKEVHTETQTRKSRFHRWQNVQSSFVLKDLESLENKHCLLLDDVMTTGATAEACAEELLKIKGLQLSFLSIAIPF